MVIGMAAVAAGAAAVVVDTAALAEVARICSVGAQAAAIHKAKAAHTLPVLDMNMVLGRAE